MAQARQEFRFFDWLVRAKGVHVLVYQFLAETVRIVGLGLPEERSHVVINRSFPSSLKVYQVRFSVFHHDVPALEVAVHEYRLGFHTSHQGLAEGIEVIFQQIFPEIYARRFQKTIFEVVQVPQDASMVKFYRRIASPEIQPFCPFKLHAGQQPDDLFQQVPFCLVKFSRLSSVGDELEQGIRAQIIL